jgi:hypothetical protein
VICGLYRPASALGLGSALNSGTSVLTDKNEGMTQARGVCFDQGAGVRGRLAEAWLKARQGRLMASRAASRGACATTVAADLDGEGPSFLAKCNGIRRTRRCLREQQCEKCEAQSATGSVER